MHLIYAIKVGSNLINLAVLPAFPLRKYPLSFFTWLISLQIIIVVVDSWSNVCARRSSTFKALAFNRFLFPAYPPYYTSKYKVVLCIVISNNRLIITSQLRFNGRDILRDTMYVLSLLHNPHSSLQFLKSIRWYLIVCQISSLQLF